MNLNLSESPLGKTTATLSNAISGEFKSLPEDSLKTQRLDLRIKPKAIAAPKNLKNLKARNANDEQLDKEISTFFNETDEDDSELGLGSAYRAEIRQESRKLRKKLIHQ